MPRPGSAKPPDPPPGAVPLDPRCGLRHRPPYSLALAVASKPCQGPALTKAGSGSGHMQVCTLLYTDNQASTPPLSFLLAGCPSCSPTNSVKPLKADIA